jgi:hypothetical protein
MTKLFGLAALAALILGCATTPTYTKPGKDSDPQAVKSALTKCESAADAACSRSADGYRVCIQRKVSDCMTADGWTEK